MSKFILIGYPFALAVMVFAILVYLGILPIDNSEMSKLNGVTFGFGAGIFTLIIVDEIVDYIKAKKTTKSKLQNYNHKILKDGTKLKPKYK